MLPSPTCSPLSRDLASAFSFWRASVLVLAITLRRLPSMTTAPTHRLRDFSSHRVHSPGARFRSVRGISPPARRGVLRGFFHTNFDELQRTMENPRRNARTMPLYQVACGPCEPLGDKGSQVQILSPPLEGKEVRRTPDWPHELRAGLSIASERASHELAQGAVRCCLTGCTGPIVSEGLNVEERFPSE